MWRKFENNLLLWSERCIRNKGDEIGKDKNKMPYKGLKE